MQPTDFFELKKNVWTEKDFEIMGWHDASIHGFAFEKSRTDEWTGELVLDIDYIFKWLNPTPPDDFFTFWVAPCTLIFRETFRLQMELNIGDFSLEELEIAGLHLVEKIKNDTGSISYRWNLELQQGTFKFESAGFSQIVRQKPIHIKTQSLTSEQRGGINFDRKPY